MFGLFALLLVYSLHYVKNEKYIKLEQEIVTILKQEDTFQQQILGNDLILIEHTQLGKYIDMVIANDKCTAKAEIRKTFLGYWYRVYLTCGNYKTFNLK